MKEIAEILLDLSAVKVSIDPPFTWTSGIKSPVYCDNRILISYVDERRKIVDAFAKKIDELDLKPDLLAGTSTAGIPWAAFLAEKLNLPMVYVRDKAKKHGTKSQIEGKIKPGSKVLIVEDLISTGSSSIITVDAIRGEGASEVLGVFAIMTWELPKAQDNFESAEVDLFNLTGFDELIPMAAEKGHISNDDVDNILSFRRDPVSWGDSID